MRFLFTKQETEVQDRDTHGGAGPLSECALLPWEPRARQRPARPAFQSAWQGEGTCRGRETEYFTKSSGEALLKGGDKGA